MTDFEWCCDRVLSMVKRSGPEGLAWEDYIIRFLTEVKYRSTWEHQPTWAARESKDRSTLIYYVIEHLIQKKRIHADPNMDQTSGDRLLRPTNVLDSIVQSL